MYSKKTLTKKAFFSTQENLNIWILKLHFPRLEAANC